MSEKIYQYEVDYVQSNGSYMKLSKTSERGFKLEDFQELQLKMIQSNRLPRLVPMSFEDVNGEISIYYRIEGLRMLRAIAKERPMSMQEFYALFINIVQALQDATNNLLSDDHYLLNEDFIYIGRGYHEVYLTYLPIKDMNDTTPLYEKLKKLLLNMAGEVQGINGAQFKMILSYIKDPGFSLQGLKELLQQLQVTKAENVDENEGNMESDQKTKQITKIKKVKKFPPLASKYKIYTILIGVLLIAVSWKLSEGSSSKLMLGVSTGLTLVIIAGVITYLFIWRPGVEPIITEKEVKVNQKANKQVKPLKNKTAVTVPDQRENISTKAFSQNINRVHDEQLNLQEVETASALHTDERKITNEPVKVQASPGLRDQTMLLDEEELLGSGPTQQVDNYLIVDRNGKEEEIKLDEDNFIIGRADKGTSFVEAGTGISRLHIELVKLSDMYGIKDLGSKNGTFINDEKIIPYKIHELKHDDKIQIGKTIYTYRVS
ncbi:hypothetical protein JOC34_000236 [Virgibacillus halotolerans]|uniref:DUF6382 domain-containing protein n=1 Tax=Virgibacillus halotolerans TaxID=1071053 RepID=UPI00195F7FD1|nr:DUF6382 domain-containing protein [Virgibacillus halotolerans]MBM7597879.1 hypothetical protein [Virgibacillus halotolerans]